MLVFSFWDGMIEVILGVDILPVCLVGVNFLSFCFVLLITVNLISAVCLVAVGECFSRAMGGRDE